MPILIQLYHLANKPRPQDRLRKKAWVEIKYDGHFLLD